MTRELDGEQERHRLRVAVLDALSQYGPSTFVELMYFMGPDYSGRDPRTIPGRRLDAALRHHRRAGRIEYDRPNECWRIVL
jgi:hypothetical protein